MRGVAAMPLGPSPSRCIYARLIFSVPFAYRKTMRLAPSLPSSNWQKGISAMSARHRFVGVARARALSAIIDRWRDLNVALPHRSWSFLLGQNAVGFWVVKSYDGRMTGIFRSKRDAVHFVHRECPDHLFDLVFMPEGLELDSSPNLPGQR